MDIISSNKSELTSSQDNDLLANSLLNEVENTAEAESTFTLQILHASDLEGGVEAIEAAPNFAAIVDYLEDQETNTITLSAGDNYLAGPFFSASGDQATFRDGGVFNNTYNQLFSLPNSEINEAYASLREAGGRVDISIMNIIGFDASALGNHEFDLGTSTLREIINHDYQSNGLTDDRWVGTQFPYLSANLDFSSDSNLEDLYTSEILPNTDFASNPAKSLANEFTPKIAPATTIEVNGEIIGVVGATTPILENISSPGDTQVIGSKTEDMTELAGILQPVIDQLLDQGINKIILVSHLQQISLETELIGLLSGVDVVIAGGSDTLLADEEDVSRGLNPGDTPADTYPLITTNKDGDSAVIVSTDGEYSYVGRLVIEFDADGKLIADSIDENVSGAFATTDEGVEALWGNLDDAFADGTKGDLVQELTDAVEGVVNTKDSQVFGQTNVFIEGRREEVRTQETTLGNLTADANLAIAKAYDPTVLVSIKNGGGIRAPIGFISNDGEFLPTQENPGIKAEGEISQLDIENSLRFNNQLSLVTLTAEGLKQILEHGVAATAEGETPGQFPQVGGLAFSFDPTKQVITFDENGNVITEGQRIRSLAIKDDEGNIIDTIVEHGEIVGNREREIRLVTLNFLADGGDSYPFPSLTTDRVNLTEVLTDEGLANFTIPGSEQDALAEYLATSFPADTNPDTPVFNVLETPPEKDQRIQNLAVKEDTVLATSGGTRYSVMGIEFIGEADFETGYSFDNTQVGGLSGITYNGENNVFYTISDDRSQNNPARFYTLNIDLNDGSLDQEDVTFTGVTTLLDEQGNPFAPNSLDPEAIALINNSDTLYITSEGDVNAQVNPFINQFSLSGEQLQALEIHDKYLPTVDGTSGIRNNLAFESLTVSPDQRYLYTAVENALIQDGSMATLEAESASRILQYELATGKLVGEFIYYTDTIPVAPNPADSFADNGLVELLALDNSGTFLALERSFSTGVGNNIRLYEVRLQGATDVSSYDSIAIDPTNPDDGLLEIDAPASKRLLLDFGELGITLDNSEGFAFGPVLPDGRQSLIVVSDNNFNETQTTQFLGFALDLKATPEITPILETPSEIRFRDPENPDLDYRPDLDDPAIYIHPDNPELSFVITTFKEGGLAVYDLEAQELQKITPDNIRYNNVDLVYNFQLGAQTVDLAVVSDRINDTLAIFQIDPDTRQVTDITAANLADPSFSIFGVDDEDLTAYGLAAYTSPISGKSYAFVSQQGTNQVAQLELIDNGAGTVTAEVIRILIVPNVQDTDLEDAQIEGMVVDQELGYLYVGQENFGIWKFAVEPDNNQAPLLIDTVNDVKEDADSRHLEDDVEGLTIYYGPDGTGYLLVSSQGDNTFAIYDRQGSNSYLGNFAIGEGNGIDANEESDGSDITSVPLGDRFPNGLLVVQDGSNDPATVFLEPGDEELQNYNTNFKYIALDSESTPFAQLPNFGNSDFDPRNLQPNSLINGVASGDTTQTSTVLWAHSTFLGDITFEYADNANFENAIALTATVTDSNLPVKVEINNLNPATEYFYRVTDAAGDTATGRLETAADAGTYQGLNFGVSGDWRGEIAPYTAVTNVAEKELNFFVALGDTIYADVASDGVKNDDGSRKEQAETVDEFRAKHNEVYSARLGLNSLADLRASTSILAMIDDHEVTNDFSGGAPTSSDPRFASESGLINDTQLYENGLQVFQEYNPLRDEFYSATGDERTADEYKLYRYNTYGSDAASFLLDNRSFRDQPLAPADVSNPEDIGRFLTESLTEDRTMLGDSQLEQLKQDLLDAQNQGITWKFIMTPEPIQNLGVLLAQDRFEGYAEERTEILGFIDENNIDNVVFVTADIHGTVVNNLTYQDTVGGEQIGTNAFEISTGSVGYNPPLGFDIVNIGLEVGIITPEAFAIYDSLPVNHDADSTPDDKDDFLKGIFNESIISLGYDPIGLNDNLENANGLIDATLLQGDYIATHTYGWTEFNIDPVTQQLKVTTYGVEPYTEADLLDNPEAILSRNPEIVSEFIVNPVMTETPESPLVFGSLGDDTLSLADVDSNSLVFTGAGNDFVEASGSSNGGNRIYGGSDDDEIYASNSDSLRDSFASRIFGGAGNDILDGSIGTGNNRLYGDLGDDEMYAHLKDSLFGGEGNDILDASVGAGENYLYGEEGDDLFFLSANNQVFGGDGADQFFVLAAGGNIITGGVGADQFWIANAQVPSASNTITDFASGVDVIGIGGLGIGFNDLSISENQGNSIISWNNQDLAILEGIASTSLTATDFAFV